MQESGTHHAEPPEEVDELLSSLPARRPPFQIWTSRQRVALLILAMVCLGFLFVELFRKPVLITDPPPELSPRGDEIQDRIDPNTADAAALAAIPDLGEKKAAEIVEYRSHYIQEHPGQIAFRSPEDLLRLKGIGVATMNDLSPYLIFPTHPTTR